MAFGKHYSDDELDEMEGHDPRVAEAARKKVIDDAEAVRLNLAIRQKVDPVALDVIRDLLTQGKDTDAIAILAKELGMVMAPRHTTNVAAIRSLNPDAPFVFGAVPLVVNVTNTDKRAVSFRANVEHHYDGARRIVIEIDPDVVGEPMSIVRKR